MYIAEGGKTASQATVMRGGTERAFMKSWGGRVNAAFCCARNVCMLVLPNLRLTAAAARSGPANTVLCALALRDRLLYVFCAANVQRGVFVDATSCMTMMLSRYLVEPLLE